MNSKSLFCDTARLPAISHAGNPVTGTPPEAGIHPFVLAAEKLMLLRASSAPARLTGQQQQLAEYLASRHGNVRVTREAHGLHFYIACPTCLQDEGEAELWKMHLALNVDKYLNGHTGAAMCMKCETKFRIDELTMWPGLEKRGYERGPAKIADQQTVNIELMEPDEKGRLVPKSPGETVPLHDLPKGHPAIEYLRSRKFGVRDLERQFNASYCWQQRSDIR